MFRSASSIIFFTVVVSLIAVVLSSSFPYGNQETVSVNRRDAPFGEILTELKGKGLVGRMRFGKRSTAQLYRSLNLQPEMEFIPF